MIVSGIDILKVQFFYSIEHFLSLYLIDDDIAISRQWIINTISKYFPLKFGSVDSYDRDL